jgi:hypothetical protein
MVLIAIGRDKWPHAGNYISDRPSVCHPKYFGNMYNISLKEIKDIFIFYIVSKVAV